MYSNSVIIHRENIGSISWQNTFRQINKNYLIDSYFETGSIEYTIFKNDSFLTNDCCVLEISIIINKIVHAE